MLRHPLLNNRMLMMYYGLFWLIVAVINAFVLTLWYDLSIQSSLMESLIFFVLYPLLGASIWFIVKYNTVSENEWHWIILYHFIGATILTAIWMYLGFIIIKIIDSAHLNIMHEELPSRIFFGYIMYTIFVAFFYAINYNMSLKEKIKREVELKALIREAELSALKSQINPHFLFNSLNSISSLTISNPSKAQEMVINLSTFMRYSLQHGEHETVSLSQEIDNIKLYLGIEKIRFGKKLNPVFEMEENCHSALIPNMILQPLYENAIKYGVYEATSPVSIKTTCIRSENGFILITIENEYEPDSVKNRGEGIGLRNIRQRLDLIYGNPELLRITDNKTSFKVELIIPQKIEP